MRTALFGGSFDPPHNGHLAIARAALRGLELDQILFAPVGLQPLKPAGSSATFEHRLEMTRLAIAGDPAFTLSLIDSPSLTPGGKPNFTYDTLLRLRPTLPIETQLFFLLGADAFRSLPHWQHSADIPFLATLIVASRPGEDLISPAAIDASLPRGLTLAAPESEAPPIDPVHQSHRVHHRLQNLAGAQADFFVLPGLQYDISATALRQQIHLLRQSPSANISPAQPLLLPRPVLDYIHLHHLYQPQAWLADTDH